MSRNFMATPGWEEESERATRVSDAEQRYRESEDDEPKYEITDAEFAKAIERIPDDFPDFPEPVALPEPRKDLKCEFVFCEFKVDTKPAWRCSVCHRYEAGEQEVEPVRECPGFCAHHTCNVAF